MKEYSLKFACGIGDILHIKAILDNIKSQYDLIKIAPNYDLIDQYRDGDFRYKSFINDLYNLLFRESPYVYDDPINLPFKNLVQLKNEGIPLISPDLIDYLTVNDFIKSNYPYITVSTKVRGISVYDYVNKYRRPFLECLADLQGKYDIFILGEKEIGFNKEYSFHTDFIFSIYPDLLFYLHRYTDFTIDELGNSSPCLNKIKIDCTLMNKAAMNVCLGIGGNFSLAASVGNLLNFRMPKSDEVDFVSEIYKNKEEDRVFSTDNFELFLRKLESL